MTVKPVSLCLTCKQWVEYEIPVYEDLAALDLPDGQWTSQVEVHCPKCGRRWRESYGISKSSYHGLPESPTG